MPDTLPRSATAFDKRARALGWPVHVKHLEVEVPDTFYVGTDRAGELKKAAHTEDHWWLAAKKTGYALGFIAHWVDGKFDYARVLDPAGQPVELYFEYKPIASLLHHDPKETEESWERRAAIARADAIRCDREYNDGTAWLVRDYIINSATEFKDWLGGWEELLGGQQ